MARVHNFFNPHLNTSHLIPAPVVFQQSHISFENQDKCVCNTAWDEVNLRTLIPRECTSLEYRLVQKSFVRCLGDRLVLGMKGPHS